MNSFSAVQFSILIPYVSLFCLPSIFRKLITDKVSTARIRFLMQVPITSFKTSLQRKKRSLECIQDVLELRTANWVARREEAGPKTIEQIHKVR